MSAESNRILELEDELKMALIQCVSLRCISEKYREDLDQLRDYSNTEITEQVQTALKDLKVSQLHYKLEASRFKGAYFDLKYYILMKDAQETKRNQKNLSKSRLLMDSDCLI